METPKLIIHIASLFKLFPEPYEAHLEDRIHAALDAGLDGVELSNGVFLLGWRPSQETLRRLRDKVVTIHAEVGEQFDVTLDQWAEEMSASALDISNVTFHPDELEPEEIQRLSQLPFPTSIENMDQNRADWITPGEMQRIPKGVGLTLDTAHAQEHGYEAGTFSFEPLHETHLSVVTDEWSHAPTIHAPDSFPHIPSSCPIVCLEGVMANADELRAEVEWVRGKLG